MSAASRAAADERLLLLGDPEEDPNWLSPPLCLVRAQIEVFAATASDIAAGTRHQPTLGQVGLRCIHCRPPRMAYQDCAKGAVSYPKSIKIIHQTVRNFQRYHVNDCPCIPSDVKERLRAYEKKKHQSKRDAKHYWVDSFRALGLCDVVMDETKREEIRFVDEDGHDHQASAEEREAIAARRVYVPPPPPLPPSELAAAMATMAATSATSKKSGTNSPAAGAGGAAAALTDRSAKPGTKRRRSKKDKKAIGSAAAAAGGGNNNMADVVDATFDGMDLAGLENTFDDMEDDSSSLFAGLGLDDDELQQASAGGHGHGAPASTGITPSDNNDNLTVLDGSLVGSGPFTGTERGAARGRAEGTSSSVIGLNDSIPSACSTNITASDLGSFTTAPDGTVASLSDLSRQTSSSSAVSAPGTAAAAAGQDNFHPMGKNMFGDLSSTPLPDPMVLTGQRISKYVRIGSCRPGEDAAVRPSASDGGSYHCHPWIRVEKVGRGTLSALHLWSIGSVDGDHSE